MKATRHFEWVKIEDLIVKPEDQRKVSMVHVYRLAANWRPESCQPLDVEKNGKGYYVIDGQHRKLAAERAVGGAVKLPCWVLNDNEALTVEQKAQHVLDVQKNRRGLCAADEFVRLAAIDVEFAKAKRILVDHRLWDDGGPKVHCLGAIRNIVRKYGALRLREVLRFVDMTWPGEEDRYQGWIISGVAPFLEHLRAFVEMDRTDFEELIDVAAERIGTRAALSSVAKRAQEMTGKVVALGAYPIMWALVDIYNTKLRTKRLPTQAIKGRNRVGAK